MKQILRITTLAVLAAALFANAFGQNASTFKEAGKVWGNVKADMAAFEKVVKAKK